MTQPATFTHTARPAQVFESYARQRYYGPDGIESVNGLYGAEQATLPTTWPTARIPAEVAGALYRRFGAAAALAFMKSARHHGWRPRPHHFKG